jgi:hypothetical protein
MSAEWRSGFASGYAVISIRLRLRLRRDFEASGLEKKSKPANGLVKEEIIRCVHNQCRSGSDLSR